MLLIITGDILPKGLYLWFLCQRDRNVPISGNVNQEKTIILKEDFLSSKDFHTNDGWLKRFKIAIWYSTSENPW